LQALGEKRVLVVMAILYMIYHHLATLFNPTCHTDQYRWFLMLPIHFFTDWHPLSLATASTFLVISNKVILTIRIHWKLHTMLNRIFASMKHNLKFVGIMLSHWE
jgi:hypothetical protein